MDRLEAWGVAISFVPFVRGEEGSEKALFAAPFLHAKYGYRLLSLEDMQPFSAAKAIVGCFCLKISRGVMYTRQLLSGSWRDVMQQVDS